MLQWFDHVQIIAITYIYIHTYKHSFDTYICIIIYSWLTPSIDYTLKWGVPELGPISCHIVKYICTFCMILDMQGCSYRHGVHT